MRAYAKRWIPGVVLMLGVLAPQISEACAVCFSGRDENRLAFILTTILLTALPLIMIGGMLLWLRRRSVRQQLLMRDEPARLGR